MSLVINNNVTSLNAQRNLGRSTKALNTSLERLSSGMRINRAADNPAGLVTSEKQRAQIAGLNQAIENSERGVSMIQTAEAALTEVNTLLTKVRGLALDSANTAANDEHSLAANQREIADALASIDRIATNSQFGSKKLFDGSNANTVTGSTGALHMTMSNSTLATGANTVVVSNFTAASYTVAAGGTGIATSPSAFGLEGLVAGDHYVTVTQASDYAQLAGDVDIEASGFKLATGDIIRLSVDGGPEENITIHSDHNEAEGIDAWVAAINDAIDRSTNYSTTGAGDKTFLAVRKNGDALEFYTGAADESGFNSGSDHSVTLVSATIADGGVSGLADIGFGAENLTAEGVDAIVVFGGETHTVSSLEVGGSVIALEDTAGNKVSIESTGAGLALGTATLTVTAATGDIGLAGAATAAFTAGEAVTLTDASGKTVDVLVSEMITSAGSEAINAVNNSLVFQIGANKDQTVAVALDDVSTNRLATGVANASSFASLRDIDVTTAEGAQSALELIDEAITQIAATRGSLGSFQANTLESNLNNLRVSAENMVAAESTLRDTDFAAEMAEFTKNQILVQAGMTVLSNATQIPQNVLSLLR